MHIHSHGPDSVAESQPAQRRLKATFGVCALIALAEVVGGVWTGSLALLADAGHMLFDLLALGIAIASLVVGARPPDATHTWGYRRFEVLGALVNGLLLIGVSVAIVWEAAHRWWDPEPLRVGAMLIVASIGLVANLVSLALLGGAHHDLSVRGALLHVIGDTLSSVGVIIGGVIIWYTGYTRIDALLSAMIAIILCVGSFRLLRDVANILLEAAPRHINTEALKHAITEVEGVAHVHDMHLWSITTGIPALSAHVVLASEHDDGHAVRTRIEAVLSERFHLVHSTLQMEPQRLAQAACTPWLTPPNDTHA